MANKDDVDFGAEDLDDLDFGDLDFNDPFEPSTDNRSPVDSFKKSTINTVKGRMLDPGMLRRLAAMALPKGYGQAFNAYDALDNAAGDIIKDNASELQPYMRSMNRKLAQASPALRRLMPKSVQDALEQSEQDENSNSYSQGPSELDQGLAGLDKLFGMQAEARVKDEFREAVKDTRENKRFASEMDALTTMGRGIGRLVGYQDSITINYQRKSLELKYRHLDVSIRTLKAQQEFFSTSKSYLDGIQKNTGLPDFVKMRGSEVVKQQLTQRLATSAMRSAGNFTSGYFNNIKQNASQMLGTALDLHGQMGMGEDIGMSRSQMFGQMAGGLAGSAVSSGLELLGGTVADKAAPYLERVPGVQAGGNWLRRNLTGIPQRLNEYAQSTTESEGVLGWAEEGLKALLDRHSPSSVVTGNRLESLDQPAIFDNMFHRAVTDQIPSFLASMDRSLRILATGEDQEELAYSHYSNSLVGRSELNKTHIRVALKDNNGQGIRGAVDDLLREMNANDLSVEAKRALRRQLLKDMTSANDFKPERYIKVNTWNSVPEEIAEELIEFFADTFGLDPSGNQFDKSQKTAELTQDVRQKFIELTDRLPDYGGRMNVLQNVVGRRSWRELGLSRHNGDYSDIIDLDKLNDLVVNEGDEVDLTKRVEEKPVFTGSLKEQMQQRAELARRKMAEERTRAAAGPVMTGAGVNDTREMTPRSGTIPPIQRAAQPASQPAEMTVNADVRFPDMMVTSDLDTHSKLDNLIDLHRQSNQWLEYVLEASLSDRGSSEGESEIADPSNPRSRRLNMMNVAKRGAMGIGRGLKGYFAGTYGMVGKGLGLARQAATSIGGAAFRSVNGLGISDIYLKGETNPALLARDIRAGHYIDVLTKKIISKLSDITGEVKDARTGNVVIAEEDFKEGLYSGDGENLAGFLGRKAVAGAGMLARGAAAYTTGVYGTLFKAARWTVQAITDKLSDVDGYLPGDIEPRIRSLLLKRGHYRDQAGKVITSIKDIVGPVFDIEGREIISQEEIDRFKALYTKTGDKLYTFGSRAFGAAKSLGGLALQGAKLYGKAAMSMYKGLWRGAASIGRGIKSLGRRSFGQGGPAAMDEELGLVNIEIQQEQLKVQQAILDFMRAKWDQEGVHGDVDGDGVREYSWQDIVRRRREAAEKQDSPEEQNNQAVVDAIAALGDRLDDNFDHLADVTEEAGESSMLENAADLADIGGPGEGGDSKGRKGKGKVGKPKGRLRRGMGRIGRGISRVIPGAGLVGRALGAVGGGIGRAAMWALPAVGSTLLTAGTAFASALGAPLILGAAAVAGVSYLGYRYYKSEQAKNYPLLYLRLTQYGIEPTNKARVENVLQLESIIRNAVSIDRSGNATIDTQSIDMGAVMKVFNITEPGQQENVFRWIATRFRPVFLAHCSAMQRIRGTTELVSADEGISDTDLDTYINIVNLSNMAQIYNDLDVSPFDSALETDNDDVEAALKMARARRKNEVQAKAATVALATATGNASKVKANTTLGVSPTGTGNVSEIARGVELASAAAASSSPSSTYTGVSSTKTNFNLDIPTAVRYKTYGLLELTLDKCEQLQKVEEVYWGVIQYSGTSKAMMGGDAASLEQKVSDIFRPTDDVVRADMIRWLNYRFIPVMLQYAISIRRRYNGDVRNGAGNLTGPAMHEVLDEVSRTMTDTLTGMVSVWTIVNSPWPGVELERMPGSVQRYLDALDKGEQTKVLDVAGLQAEKRIAGASANYGTTLTNTALGNQRSSPTSPGVGNTGPTLANYGKIYGQGQVAGGALGQTKTGVGDGSLLMGGPMGRQVQHPGAGPGGDINSLPNATGKGWQAMGPLIQEAAKMVGFDPMVAANVAGIESNFDPNASSGIAKGLYQFVNGTWSDMMRKYGATYGIAPGTPPEDPRANAILGMCYLKENYQGLQRALGGNVSDLDLYMAHFLGLGGAKRFLTAPRNAPAYEHVGNGKSAGNNVVNNNGSIFVANNRNRTVGEVLGEMDRRMNNVRKKTGSPLSATPAQEVATNVPQGNAPTETPVANPTPGAAAVVAEAGGVSDESAGLPTSTPAVGATMAAAAMAANGGASGTPTNAAPAVMPVAMPMVMPMAQPEEPAPVPTPAINASRMLAATSQATSATEQAGIVETVAPILEKQLTRLESMDDTLKAMLRNQLQALNNSPAGKATPLVAAVEPTPASQAPEPLSRTPLSSRRQNAVT